MDRQAIVNLFQNESSFNLVSHMLPDGDSIGSLLALGEALQNMGKEAKLFSPGGVPKKYAFLKGSAAIAGHGMPAGAGNVAVVLDSSDLERASAFQKELRQARHLINIDHHVTNQFFGTLNLVDPEASATGEIIYQLLVEMRLKITESMAEALYVAIATDTGSFKYDNTTAAAHRVAADLLERNLNPGALSQRIFDERPLAFYLLLREALSTLEFYAGHKIALITLSKDMLQRCGTTVEEIDGLVNYTRNIEGVELGILFYVESGGEIKVGFRSRKIDVSVLAGKLNGGGHARAAGCRMRGGLSEVKQKVLTAALDLLRQNKV
jgi:phosphoesterase RecJ-like protein